MIIYLAGAIYRRPEAGQERRVIIDELSKHVVVYCPYHAFGGTSDDEINDGDCEKIRRINRDVIFNVDAMVAIVNRQHFSMGTAREIESMRARNKPVILLLSKDEAWNSVEVRDLKRCNTIPEVISELYKLQKHER
jgi:nucleoside 2-deoxyribosyltransferase